MKKLLSIFAVVLISSVTMGQSTTENYIKTKINRNTLTDRYIETTTYFDGLGRPMQTISQKAGGAQQDIITHIAYDSLGRQDKDYLPYAITANGGLYSTDAFNATNSFYSTSAKYDHTANPYSEKRFEASPLNRVQEQAAPGEDWKLDNDHTIKFDYQSNAVDEVKHYQVHFDNGDSEKPQLSYTGYYDKDALFKTLTKDENWKTSDGNKRTTEEFKDKQGRILLKRTYADSSGVTVPYNTHYVYDDFGNLSFVIPPKASAVIIDEVIIQGANYTPFTTSFPASTFVTGSGSGSMVAGIVDLGNDQFEYSITFNLSRLTGSIKTGDVLTLPSGENLPDTFLFLAVDIFNPAGTYTYSILNGKIHVALAGSPVSIKSLNNAKTIVLPTGASTTTYVPNQNTLSELCYQYTYDYRNRLIEKKIPGKGRESIVYNILDQPVLTQDMEQELADQWLFTKYDGFGRMTYTGTYTSNLSRENLQTTVNNHSTLYETKTTTSTQMDDGTQVYYTKASFPDTGTQSILTVNYYDTYTFNLDGGTNPNTVYTVPVTGNTKALATGSMVRVLGTSDWITTVSYYDEHGRSVYTYSKNNYLGTTDITESKLSFMGLLEQSKSTHKKTGKLDIETEDVYAYDIMNRLTKQTQVIDSQPAELIAENVYDELGQLITKKVGHTASSSTRLQTIDYTYNIRGWLKNINQDSSNDNDLFNFSINYNDPGNGATALYNGNISETIWKTANDNTERWYKYGYDNFDRLVSAVDNTTNYNLNSVTYDKMGNIMSLSRNGWQNTSTFTNKDNLVYTYQNGGNKLQKVLDNGNDNYGFKDGANLATEYTYDANANLITDANKGITSILYNHLNLPTEIKFDNSNTKKINYTYSADAVKLRKVVNDGGAITTLDYAGNYVYENNTLQFFKHPEGYVTPSGSGYRYVYQYKDHIDNIRLSYSDADDNGTIAPSEIIQENNYQPFGLKMRGFNNNTNSLGNSMAERYMFGGKEFDDSFNEALNTYDFGARNYDPALGRWMNIDPLAEQMRRHSPYNYAFDNPIYFQDPDGMMPQGCCGNIIKKVKQFFSELVGDAETLASSQGTDTGAASRLERKSEILTSLENNINQLNENVENVIDNIPILGEAGVVAAKVGMSENAEPVKEKLIENAPFTALGVIVPGLSGKNAKKIVKTVKKRVKTSSGIKGAKKQFEGIQKAQAKAKKEIKGQKQNSIFSMKKSKQREKNALKRIDIDDIEE